MNTASRLPSTLHYIAQWLVILSPLLMVAGRAPTDIGLSLVAILFIAHSAVTCSTAWLRECWVQVALALCAYMCLRNLLLDTPWEAFGHSLAWLRYPVYGAALAYWILPETSVRKKLVYCFTGVLIFLGLDGLWQFHSGADIFGRTSVYYELAPRLTGPFSSPRLGITMAWVFLPVAMYWLNATAGNMRSRAFAAAVLFYCSMIGVIFFSAERMAFIFAIFGSGLAFLVIRHLRRQLFITGLFALLVVALFALYNPGLIARQFGQTNSEVTNFTEGSYGKSFAEGWQLTLSNPAIGIGGKHYQQACRDIIQKADPTAFCGMHPHNFYLDWLSEYGVIGAGMMVAMILLWFNHGFAHWQLVRGDALIGALFIMLIVRFWPIASVTSQFTVWSAYPQWLVTGWFLAAIAATKKA